MPSPCCPPRTPGSPNHWSGSWCHTAAGRRCWPPAFASPVSQRRAPGCCLAGGRKKEGHANSVVGHSHSAEKKHCVKAVTSPIAPPQQYIGIVSSRIPNWPHITVKDLEGGGARGGLEGFNHLPDLDRVLGCSGQQCCSRFKAGPSLRQLSTLKSKGQSCALEKAGD